MRRGRIQARSAAVPLDGMIERDEVFAALEVPFGDERRQQVDPVGEAVWTTETASNSHSKIVPPSPHSLPSSIIA